MTWLKRVFSAMIMQLERVGSRSTIIGPINRTLVTPAVSYFPIYFKFLISELAYIFSGFHPQILL